MGQGVAFRRADIQILHEIREIDARFYHRRPRDASNGASGRWRRCHGVFTQVLLPAGSAQLHMGKEMRG